MKRRRPTPKPARARASMPKTPEQTYIARAIVAVHTYGFPYTGVPSERSTRNDSIGTVGSRIASTFRVFRSYDLRTFSVRRTAARRVEIPLLPTVHTEPTRSWKYTAAAANTTTERKQIACVRSNEYRGRHGTAKVSRKTRWKNFVTETRLIG